MARTPVKPRKKPATTRRRGTGRPFEKGKSGNPGGRPKELAHVKDLARTHTESAIKTLAEIMRSKKASPNARVSAADAILDRAWGRPAQAIEMSGPGGGPIDVNRLAGLTDEQLSRLEAVLDEVVQDGPGDGGGGGAPVDRVGPG
jgi:hypothetical protein